MSAVLKEELGLALPETISQDEIVQHLAKKIATLLKGNQETLFQIMYRLDVSEKKLNAVIREPDAAFKIAWLVYERQLEKYRSRQQHKATKKDPDKDLEW
ncbi:hypothetical protein [Polluticoccus soli]|uniref:hypothetical protein n=1 Tax=Polluticoccus soli TaxID=3034150 RepID=UPI0023E09977|nr:hypothetical protein [Flavipsychrobacter sp. JY13-12]